MNLFDRETLVIVSPNMRGIGCQTANECTSDVRKGLRLETKPTISREREAS